MGAIDLTTEVNQSAALRAGFPGNCPDCRLPGFGGIAGAAVGFAKFLFFLFLVFFVVALIVAADGAVVCRDTDSCRRSCGGCEKMFPATSLMT